MGEHVICVNLNEDQLVKLQSAVELTKNCRRGFREMLKCPLNLRTI